MHCKYCNKEVSDMNELTDHVGEEHDAIRAAITGDINALIDELQMQAAGS